MRTILLVIVAACMAACEDTTTPALSATSYALGKVRGQPLPYNVATDPSFRVDITAGALTLKRDGSYKIVLAVHTTWTHANPTPDVADSSTGTWNETSTQITLSSTQCAYITCPTVWSKAGSVLSTADGWEVTLMPGIY